MSFARPDLLWLCALAPVLVALAVRTRQTRVRAGRLVAVTALRAALLLALAVAAAGPHRSAAAPRAAARTIVYVLDASTSVDADLARGALLADAGALDARDRVGVVAVAASATWLRPVAPGSLDLQTVRADGAGSRDASRLALGLRLARAGAPTDGTGEVVLVSDGRPTDDPDQVVVEAAALAAAGIAVRVLPVGREGVDARADALTLDGAAGFVHDGAGVRLTARVSARPQDGDGVDVDVALLRDGQGREAWTRRLRLGPVPVALTFVDRADAPGAQRYRLVVRAPGDVEPRNDVSDLVVTVRGGPRLLLVSADAGGGDAVGAALRAAGFALEVVAPDAVAATSDALAPFDGVVLVDVPARGEGALSEDAQRALGAYAREGGGVLVFGGERSFGPGGYRGAPLEDVLPVRSEPPAWAELPDVALVLLVDRSGSMGRGPKLEVAKVAAREAASFLGARDVLGVIAFRADAEWLVKPMRGAQATVVVQEALTPMAQGGGTDLMPALILAADALEATDARVKHVVVLSDGIAPRAEEVLAAVSALRDDGVTTSAVAVGPDADQEALQRVADAGGGRFHGARDLATVPRIVAEETLDAARRSATTPPFRPRVVRAARVLDGLAFERAPELVGLLPTDARPEGEVLLAGPGDEPLLVVWDVGLGRCAVWTSDAGARWARAFCAWEGFGRLVGQLARAVVRPPERADAAGRALDLWLDGDLLRVRCVAPTGAPARLELEPGGALPLDEVAAGAFVGRGPRPADGEVRARVGATTRTLVLGPALLAEVQALKPDHVLLDAVTAAGAAPRPPAAPRRADPLVTPLLLLACGLLLAEVVVRRAA